MKKLFLMLLVGTLFASCSHSIYSTQTLTDNYNMQMTSKKELAVKEQIKIYTAEDKINGDYEVLYVNQYKPFSIPILRPYKKQMKKKFYKQITTKASDLKGDAVIVEGIGNYKVIKFK